MSKKLDALLAKTKKLIKKMSTILNLCKLYRFMNWILVWRQIILTIGNINPKLITIIARKNSLFIIRSLAILKIENSDVKNQNSSIFAIGSITTSMSKINSMKLKKKYNYVSIARIKINKTFALIIKFIIIPHSNIIDHINISYMKP